MGPEVQSRYGTTAGPQLGYGTVKETKKERGRDIRDKKVKVHSTLLHCHQQARGGERGSRVGMCIYVSFEQGLDVFKLHLRVDLDGVDFTVFGEDGDAHLFLQVRWSLAMKKRKRRKGRKG